MSFFASQVTSRIHDALSSLAAAKAEGDDFMEAVRLSELADLHRLALDNGVELPGELRAC